MMNIKLATENRKETAQRLSEITGAEVLYTRAPRFAYEIGAYTIEKDGSITIAEDAGLQPLKTLAEEGLVEPFETEDENRISLTVEVPLAQHTGTSLRNLINLLYTREGLINKALGTSFRVDEGLTKALQDNACTLTTESHFGAITAYEQGDRWTFLHEGEDHHLRPSGDGRCRKDADLHDPLRDDEQAGPGPEAHSGQGGKRREREIRPPDLVDPPGDERA